MTTELATIYEPKKIEDEIYRRWLTAGAFHADGDADGKKYCIVIPPPNVTAELHLGHALNNTLQDILIRYNRMRQHNTLWMPGTDHAGIATQTVVEKRLLAEGDTGRKDLGREKFVERVQAWKDQYEARIIDQLKLMGCSCDLQRTRFTMDQTCARAVREAFFKLFADGLIYRGKRLVNWDPHTQTVLADDEVEHETVQGHFWYLKYPLADPVQIDGTEVTHVTVATTRPETMLGDTAVAMNRRDPRAKALVGKEVQLPIVGRAIPILADDSVVLPDAESEDEKARFSTGFLKVTPAHDQTDWEIGLRHDLAVINVMAPDGTISDKYGWHDAGSSEVKKLGLLGMDRFDARKAVVEWFDREGLLADVRDYAHEVGHSYRSHVPIEPYLSDQWYIAVKKQIASLPDEGTVKDTDIPKNSLAGLALTPLLDERIKFTPDRYAKTYQSWLENLRDWPISRQLWWGHRIPIWSFIPKQPGVTSTYPDASIDKAGYLAELQSRLHEYSKCKGLGEGAFLARGTADRDKCFIAPRNTDADAAFLEDIVDYLKFLGSPGVTDGKDIEGSEWVHAPLDMQTFEAVKKVAEMLPEKRKDSALGDLEQDEDVLDTWFSSSLWPFSTMGWPEDTPELKTFYPGDVLCTAREIITLWVSRMVMLGQYCVGDIPFTDVFIHAMIQDGQGRKMSKSLGNGIDPLIVIDSHGADAMRFTLAAMTTQTQDVRMPVEQVELPDGRKVNTSRKFDLGRNFCNKLWNAARFAMMNLSAAPAWDQANTRSNLADRWILSRLSAIVRDTTAAAEGFRFNEMADGLYHFMWDDFCDWYLEIAKVRISAGDASAKTILAHCLDALLRLLHPICPFITEAIWERLNEVAPVRSYGVTGNEKMLVTAQWPKSDADRIDQAAEEQFSLLQELIRNIRNVRIEHGIAPSKTVDVAIAASGPAAAMLTENVELLKSLASIGEISIQAKLAEAPTTAASVTAGGVRLYVLGIIDPTAERKRLEKKGQTLQHGIKAIESKLANENFLTKAPADLVEREKNRLAELRRDMEAVSKSLESLSRLNPGQGTPI